MFSSACIIDLLGQEGERGWEASKSCGFLTVFKRKDFYYHFDDFSRMKCREAIFGCNDYLLPKQQVLDAIGDEAVQDLV